jgi:choice-of-anchor A domain-containing protein
MKITKSIKLIGNRLCFLPALTNVVELGHRASATPHAVPRMRVAKPLVRVLGAALVVTGLCTAGTQSTAAASIDLGSAGAYDVLGLSGATIHLSSGPLRVYGNVGIGQNGTFNFDGGGQVSGELDADPTATVNISGNSTVAGGINRISMAGVQAAALAEATSAGSLTPTQSFTSITSPLTISGDGGQNVISVSQDIHLSGGNLILSGGPSDTFIFNIAGTMELSGNTNIELSGGLQPDQVLFNFLGSGSQVQTSGNSDTVGIFLAPDRVFNINGGTHIGEFISGESLSFQSNPILYPVPEVSTWMMLGLGLGLIFMLTTAARRVSRASQN